MLLYLFLMMIEPPLILSVSSLRSHARQTDIEHLNTAVPDDIVAHRWNITRHKAVVMD